MGGDGIVTTEVGNASDYARSVAIQSNGKIVVAGWSYNGSKNVFALVRYNLNGSLDESFDDDGIVTTSIGSGNAYAQSVAIQSDGKIVVTGWNHNGSNTDFALVRYNTDGSLDASFDNDGIVTTQVGSDDSYAYSVAIQSDGKIVASGKSWNNNNDDFTLVRYNPDGSLDLSFGVDGIVTTGIGSGYDHAYSVAIQRDGKIVVTGASHNDDFVVVRYNPDGSLDASFDSDGIVTTVIEGGVGSSRSVTIQSDGKIVVAGYICSGGDVKFALLRYNPDGSLDTSFDSDGIVATALGTGDSFAYSVAIQSNGKIVVAGGSWNDSKVDFALVRYNPDGSRDTSFGRYGRVTTAIAIRSKAYSIIIQSDGKIVVAGDGSGDFTVVRYIGDPMILTPIYYLLQ